MQGRVSLPGNRAGSYLCSRRPCGRQRGATGASTHHRTGGGASAPAAPRRSSQETRHDQPPRRWPSEQRGSRARGGRSQRRHAELARVRPAAQQVPQVRLPADRAVPRVVLPLRPAVRLREGLHGHARCRQHHVGPDPRAPPVRLHLRHHDDLRPLGRPRVRPRGRSPRPEDGRGEVSALLTSAASLAPVVAPAATTVGNPAINIGIFALFVVVTLAIVIRASRNNRSAAEYYAGGRAFTGRQNGIAIAGDYLSAASFLGIAGAIAINGYDGFLYSIGFLVAWLVALLLVAELLRNVGKYTMADVLSFRLRQRPVRIAAAISTLVVSFFYLLAQMAGAGGLVALLLGIEGALGQRLVIGAAIMTVWVLGKFGFSLSTLLGEATTASQDAGGKDLLQPGLQYKNPVDFISLSMALVLGTAGLPHVLMRFYTVPTSREARRSVVWAIWLIG